MNNIIFVKVNDDEIKKLENIIKENNQLEVEYDKGLKKLILLNSLLESFKAQ